MASDIRFIRLYVHEVKSGNLAMGSREVFVTDADSVYPEVYSVGCGGISLVLKDDFDAAEDRELTPSMAATVLKILSDKKESLDPKVLDAEIRIKQYCSRIQKEGAVSSPPQRQRVRQRKPEPKASGRKRVRATTEKVTETRVRRRKRS